MALDEGLGAAGFDDGGEDRVEIVAVCCRWSFVMGVQQLV